MPDLEAESIIHKYRKQLAYFFFRGIETFETLDLVVGIEVDDLEKVSGIFIPRSFLKEDPDLPPELEMLTKEAPPEIEGETTFWVYVMTQDSVYLGHISVTKVPPPKPKKAPKGTLLN
jgi:hypothetical protein